MSLDLTVLLSSLTPSTGGTGAAVPDMQSAATGDQAASLAARFSDLVEQLAAGQAMPAAPDGTSAAAPVMSVPVMPTPPVTSLETAPGVAPGVAPAADALVGEASVIDAAPLAMPRPVQTQMIDIQIAATAPEAVPTDLSAVAPKTDAPQTDAPVVQAPTTEVPPAGVLLMKSPVSGGEGVQAQAQAEAPIQIPTLAPYQAPAAQTAAVGAALVTDTQPVAQVMSQAEAPVAEVPVIVASAAVPQRPALPAEKATKPDSDIAPVIGTTPTVIAPVAPDPVVASPVPGIAPVDAPAVPPVVESSVPVIQASTTEVASVSDAGAQVQTLTLQARTLQARTLQTAAGPVSDARVGEARPQAVAASVVNAAPVKAEATKPVRAHVQNASPSSEDQDSSVNSAESEASVAQMAADAGLVPVVIAPVVSPVQASAPSVPSQDLLATAGTPPVAPTPDLGGSEPDTAAQTPVASPNMAANPQASTASGTPDMSSAPQGARLQPSAQQAAIPPSQPAQSSELQMPQTQVSQTQVSQAQASAAVSAATEQVAAATAATARPFRLINTDQTNTYAPRAANLAATGAATGGETGAAAPTETVTADVKTPGIRPVAAAPVRQARADAVAASDTGPATAPRGSAAPVSDIKVPDVKLAEATVGTPATPEAAVVTSVASAPLISTIDASALTVPALTLPASAASLDTASSAPVITQASQMSQAATENMGALGLAISKRVTEGTTRFAMELHPADMGRVDVQLRIDRTGELTAHLSFDDAITSTAFRARESELREQLSQTGLNLSANALSFSSRAEPPSATNPSSAEARPNMDAQQGGGQNQNQPSFAQDQQRANPQAAARALASRALDNAERDTSLADLSYRPGSQTLALNLIV